MLFCQYSGGLMLYLGMRSFPLERLLCSTFTIVDTGPEIIEPTDLAVVSERIQQYIGLQNYFLPNATDSKSVFFIAVEHQRMLSQERDNAMTLVAEALGHAGLLTAQIMSIRARCDEAPTGARIIPFPSPVDRSVS